MATRNASRAQDPAGVLRLIAGARRGSARPAATSTNCSGPGHELADEPTWERTLIDSMPRVAQTGPSPSPRYTR